MDPAVRRFYRITIWLPVLLPLAAGLLAKALVAVFGMNLAGIAGGTLQFLASLIFFGVPYIPFALLATWWMRRRDEEEIRFLMFVLPVIMLVICFILCAIMAVYSGRPRVWVEVAGFATAVILPVGYGFVLLTVVLRHLQRRRV